jgi:hypothetical protein
VTGHSSNVVTVSTNAQTFHGLSLQQWSGIKTTDPRIASASSVSASGSNTITSGAFTAAAARSVALFGLCNESLSNSWTAGAGYTIPSGATNLSGYVTSQYQLFTSPQSGVTAEATNTSTQAKTILGAVFEGADQGGSGTYGRRFIIN